MPTNNSAVLFKFKPEVSSEHKETFARELKKLRDLPSVLNKRLVVGGPSVTEPIERSRGYHYALVSYHKDKSALAEYVCASQLEKKHVDNFARYQASDEHHR